MHDTITKRAAEMFEVEPENVTKTMRNYAKLRLHSDNYSAGEIKIGLQVGEYPPRA